MKYRFRSKKEVGRFLESLKKTNGNETLAIGELRGPKKPNKKTHKMSTTRKTPSPWYKVLEYVEPSRIISDSDGKEHGGNEEGEAETNKEETNPEPRLLTNGHVKPIIKKAEKVYARWSGGTGWNWFPGRVWDVKESPGAEYGPEKKYDVVFDDGDTEPNVGEIWIAKKADYEVCLEKRDEEDWIGVKNVRFPDSKDEYARMIGWYETCLDGVQRVYSSLGEALRAHDKHIVKTKGRNNCLAAELNFPEEHHLLFE